MTTTVLELLGHRLRLRAVGGALVESQWYPDSLSPTSSSLTDETELRILKKTKLQLREYSEGVRRDFDLPLRPTGTPFRMKVWNELRGIPYGETITYAELARRIGRPTACRAVANACGANPLPVIIPCHRVVASGNRPGGYTGPAGIKDVLLALEKQNRVQ